jgi:urea transport system ATP-binding protein
MSFHNPDAKPVLHVKDVTVKFGGFTAIKDLNLSIDHGELRVIIGPNGAGKTTLLDVVTGKTRPNQGSVTFRPKSKFQHDLTALPQQTIAHLGVGRKFQTPNVFKSLSVLDNLRLALKAKRGVMASLMATFRSEGQDKIDEIVSMIGLSRKANTKSGILAHGEKQWLEIGMLMAQDPELLLIDEPVAGMTPRESERTGQLLIDMAKKHTLIVIDHDMAFVRQIAQRVSVLHEGQNLCDGTVDEVQRDPKVIEVYLGDHKDETEYATHGAHPAPHAVTADRRAVKA